jgi:hypothetical protein
MNTKFRIFRTVLLSAALTLPLLSCSDVVNGTDEAGVTPSSSSVEAGGNPAVSSSSVEVGPGLSSSSVVAPPPQGSQSFEVGAQVYWRDGTPFTGDMTVRSEKEYGEGELEVGQVVAGKFTLKLPPAEEMDRQIIMADEDITMAGEIAEECESRVCPIAVSSNTAKYIGLESYLFRDTEGDEVDLNYVTYYPGSDEEKADLHYIYFSEAVTVSGTLASGTSSYTFDINAHAGWNRVLEYVDGKNYISTTNLSKMEDLGLKWTIEGLPQQVAP